MRTFERLRLKLNKELDLNLPEDTEFRRTYSGYWQLSMGAWKWLCYHHSISYDFGSCFTATEILNAKKISIYNGHKIFVDE